MAQVVEVDGVKWWVSPLNVQSFTNGDMFADPDLGKLSRVCGVHFVRMRPSGPMGVRLSIIRPVYLPGGRVILAKTWPLNTPLLRVVGGRAGGGSR